MYKITLPKQVLKVSSKCNNVIDMPAISKEVVNGPQYTLSTLTPLDSVYI